MEEIAGVTAAGDLVAFALVKAYSGKVLTQVTSELETMTADISRISEELERLKGTDEEEDGTGGQP